MNEPVIRDEMKSRAAGVLRSLLWIVPVGLVVAFVGRLGWQRWNSSGAVAPVVKSEPARQPVRVVTAQQSPLQAWVFAEGTARSAQREYLTFEKSGRVVFVGPKKEGELVKAGQVLAYLDKRKYVADVDSALASLEEAKTKIDATTADAGQARTQLNLVTSQFKRVEELHQRKVATESEYEEAKAKLDNAKAALVAAQAQTKSVETGLDVMEARLRQMKVALEETQLVSPIDGIVAYLNLEVGYYFTPTMVKSNTESEALQTVPMVVIDPTRFEITVDVPSYEAGKIEVGQKVLVLPGGSSEAAAIRAMEGEPTPTAVRGDGTANWVARGRVYSVNPAVNPGGRSIRVKIRTGQAADQLRDGMFVTCWIATEEKPTAIVAPFDAFLYEENRPYVFVLQPENETVQRRDVVFGIQGLTRREIVLGVAAGERLVTDGRYRLVDGAPVKVLPSRESAEVDSVKGGQP